MDVPVFSITPSPQPMLTCQLTTPVKSYKHKNFSQQMHYEISSANCRPFWSSLAKCRHFANILKWIFKTENIYHSNFNAVSLGPQNSICSYNELVVNRQYAITWSNDDTVHLHMISVITLDYTHWFPICVTGTLCGEFTGKFHPQRPATRSFDVFFDLPVNKRLSKELRRRWFETPSRSLWLTLVIPDISRQGYVIMTVAAATSK